MKALLLFVTFFVFLPSGYAQYENLRFSEEQNFTEVDSRKATELESQFVLSTFNGRILRVFNFTSSKKLFKNFKKNWNEPYDFNTGNAFSVIGSDGKHYICTDSKITGEDTCVTRIGKGISLISRNHIFTSEEFLREEDLVFTYQIDTTIRLKEEDTLFIQGYATSYEGMIRSVFIKGVGHKKKAEDFLDKKSDPYFHDIIMIMKISKDLNLKVLTGAPVFDNKGRVVGVLSGFFFLKNEEDEKEHFLVISLFK